MGIKNSKQSVNISTIPKKDAKKSEVTEKGDTSEKADDDNLKVESIKNLVEEVSGEKEVSSPKAEDDLEPEKDDASNGQVVPVLKVEDVEVTGVEEGDKEVAKPTMSKIASMKRDLSFGRLQKMFSREAKSEPPQQDAAAKVADEPSPDSELSATDEKQVKAEEAMGEEVKSEEVKGEDIESRVTGLKRSLMKMFTRESEAEVGATSATSTSPTPAAATENEGDEEKKGEEEGSPTKMSSLKKRLSFKAMRSKFSKEKKEANAGEDNNEEKKEASAGEENNDEKKETEKEENVEKESEEGAEKKDVEEEDEAATAETKQEVEVPAHADAKVNQDDAEAGPSSPTVVASVLPEELQQSGGDADKQAENVDQEPLVGEGGQPELETGSSKKGE